MLYHHLYLRKEAGLLREREKQIFTRELENINCLDHLDHEAGLPGFGDLDTNVKVLAVLGLAGPDLGMGIEPSSASIVSTKQVPDPLSFLPPATWLNGGVPVGNWSLS